MSSSPDDFLAGDHAPLFAMPLDPRVAMTIGGIAADGTLLPMTPDRFATPSALWATTKSTPQEVAGLLVLSGRLYAHGCFVYDFATVAVHYALLALEAALSARLERSRDSLAQLIGRAVAESIIDSHEAERLDKAARHLRNCFSHPKRQSVWTPAMASAVIGSIHQSIANLYPD